MRWARSLERPAALSERLGRDLLLQDRIVMPDERIAQAQAVDPAMLVDAMVSMLRSPVTMTLAGRIGRGDPRTALAGALGGA
jgi:hypothetical protein